MVMVVDKSNHHHNKGKFRNWRIFAFLLYSFSSCFLSLYSKQIALVAVVVKLVVVVVIVAVAVVVGGVK
jgi:hypothetical protein